MKLVIDNLLKDNVYSVTVKVEELSVEDNELFSDYGAQYVDISATISTEIEVDDGEGGVTTEEKTLLTEGKRYKLFPTDFPITRSFSAKQFGANTELIANTYADDLELRIKTIVENLRTKGDNFTSTRETLL